MSFVAGLRIVKAWRYSPPPSSRTKSRESSVFCHSAGDWRLPRKISPRVPSRNSRHWKAVKSEVSNHERTDTCGGSHQQPLRPDRQRRLQHAMPTSGARPIRSISRLLVCGGGARRRVLEMTFAAEVGVTDAGKAAGRGSEKSVVFQHVSFPKNSFWGGAGGQCA